MVRFLDMFKIFNRFKHNPTASETAAVAAPIHYPVDSTNTHPFDRSLIWKRVTQWEVGDTVLPEAAAMGVAESAIHDANDRAAFSMELASATAFPGIVALGIIAQLPEFRSLLDSVSSQMLTKKWTFHTDGGADSEKLKEIEREFERLGVEEILKKAVRAEMTFGRSHILFDIGAPIEEFVLPLKDRKSNIKKGALKALRLIEPLWASPIKYNSSRPWEDYFYDVEEWNLIGYSCHETRLHTFVSDPVSDYLRPAYVFCGISLVQKILPHLDNNLQTTQYVQDIVKQSSFKTLGMDMESLLTPGYDHELKNRIDYLNQNADTRNTFVINKETEEFAIHSIPLQGLPELQAQSLEKVGSLAGIPMIIWLGTTPQGLNASSAGEMQAWNQRLGSWRKALLLPFLERLLCIVQLSLYGEIDDSIKVTLEPTDQPSELEQSQIELNKANAAAAYVQINALSPESVSEAVLAADNEYSTSVEEEKRRLAEHQQTVQKENRPVGRVGGDAEGDVEE